MKSGKEKLSKFIDIAAFILLESKKTSKCERPSELSHASVESTPPILIALPPLSRCLKMELHVNEMQLK